jgi:hypothetical protein
MDNKPKLIANEPKFLEHLLKYNLMTDNEIMEKATVNNVIDAEYALKLFAERDICKDATAYIIDELSKLKLDELQNIATEKGISLTNDSGKRKKKADLANDIFNF